MTPRQAEALRLQSEGLTRAQIAEHFGTTVNGVKHLLDRARKARAAGETVGAGVVGALANLGVEMGAVKGGWLKSREASIQFRMPELPDDTLDRIRAAFEGLEPARLVTPPEAVLDDLCTVYPLMDLHLGMKAWGVETGDQDYDLNLACADLRHAFAKVAALTPPSKEAVLILGGDTLHADDDRAETPTSKHKLDVDGRQHKVIETAIAILSEVIENLLGKHDRITVRTLRGNHDQHSHMVLTFALSERYRDEPRITVERSPRDLFMKQWGRSAIFAHHGDKGKPEQMALYISDVCPFWSETRHRHYFVGHVHHDNAKDIGPLRYESLRAFCPPRRVCSQHGLRCAAGATGHHVPPTGRHCPACH